MSVNTVLAHSRTTKAVRGQRPMTDVLISETYSGYRSCYHTDADCGQLLESHKTVSKAYAEDRMGLRLCKHCDGIDRSKQDNSWYEFAKNKDVEVQR